MSFDIEPSQNKSITKHEATNTGGAPRLKWFNILCTDPTLDAAREHLVGKIADTEVENGCLMVKNFKETTRPVADTRFAHALAAVPGMPKRFSPYVLAMAKEQIPIPERSPPPLPSQHRQVKQKRSSASADGNNKDATWVCSHLCHNRKCINTAHLRWEPSWFNRLRDNCAGGEECPHRPYAVSILIVKLGS